MKADGGVRFCTALCFFLLLVLTKISRTNIYLHNGAPYQTDIVKKVESILRSDSNSYGATFYEIGEHSPIAGVRAGIKAYRDAGCDFIVAVGGGSPVDASKAIIYNLHLEEGQGGDKWENVVKQIAVPTTLSAAEYTVSGLLIVIRVSVVEDQ